MKVLLIQDVANWALARCCRGWIKYLPEIEFQTWTTQQQGEIRVNPQEFDAFLFSDWWLLRYVPDELRSAIFAKSIARITSHHFDYLVAEARLAGQFLPQCKVLV